MDVNQINLHWFIQSILSIPARTPQTPRGQPLRNGSLKDTHRSVFLVTNHRKSDRTKPWFRSLVLIDEWFISFSISIQSDQNDEDFHMSLAPLRFAVVLKIGHTITFQHARCCLAARTIGRLPLSHLVSKNGCCNRRQYTWIPIGYVITTASTANRETDDRKPWCLVSWKKGKLM